MSRAVVFGTLMPDPGNSEDRADLVKDLAWAADFSHSGSDAALAPLRTALADAYRAAPPRVLDCFAGGGAIPLEAVRLGCNVTALDVNPVAHLLERGCLEYPQRWGRGDGHLGNQLAEDFLTWSQWIQGEVATDLSTVFPRPADHTQPTVYFWCRTMVCSNPVCNREIPLVASRWLANSSRRLAWIEFSTELNAIAIKVCASGSPSTDPTQGTIKASSATCPACETSVTAKNVRTYGRTVGFGSRLYAVLDIFQRQRTYRDPTNAEISGAFVEAKRLLTLLPELPDGTSAVPDEDMVKSQYRRYGNLVYGIDTFAGLWNTRQLYVLGRLSQAVRDAYVAMTKTGMDPDRARALATYLGFVVDKIAEHNSAFATWQATGREASRGTFPRQAITMAWDYVETHPMSGDDGGIWAAHTRWIELALRHCSQTSPQGAQVIRGNAQALPFENDVYDAVIVDPPYYDAIQYGDMSDFFYVWLKRSVGPLYPELFVTPLTPKQQEVIETRADKTSAEYVSHEDFEARLQRALAEMARVTKPDGLVSIVFAHTDVAAWEHLLRALRTAGLVVSTSWPMRSEREARSTAQISAVLGSSVVLVCRKASGVGEGYYDDVVRQLEGRISDRLDHFDGMGLVGADYFASAVGPAFEVFAQYAKVIRLSGDEVDVSELMVLARQVVARRAMGRLLGDESISDLDPVSLLYLTWRWAYKNEAIPADEAYKLERALDVDLSSLEGPTGLAVRTASGFSLRGPDDRRGLKLGHSPMVVDILHEACLLWDGGRRRELELLLSDTGMADDRAFWSLARALAEVLPDGDRERTILLGLTGSQDAISSAAAKAGNPRPEQQQLL